MSCFILQRCCTRASCLLCLCLMPYSKTHQECRKSSVCSGSPSECALFLHMVWCLSADSPAVSSFGKCSQNGYSRFSLVSRFSVSQTRKVQTLRAFSVDRMEMRALVCFPFASIGSISLEVSRTFTPGRVGILKYYRLQPHGDSAPCTIFELIGLYSLHVGVATSSILVYLLILSWQGRVRWGLL